MPDITEVHASYSRRVQLERYEPIEHSVTLIAELGDDENADEAYEELAEQAEDNVEREIARRIAATKLGEDEDGSEG